VQLDRQNAREPREVVVCREDRHPTRSATAQETGDSAAAGLVGSARRCPNAVDQIGVSTSALVAAGGAL